MLVDLADEPNELERMRAANGDLWSSQGLGDLGTPNPPVGFSNSLPSVGVNTFNPASISTPAPSNPDWFQASNRPGEGDTPLTSSSWFQDKVKSFFNKPTPSAPVDHSWDAPEDALNIPVPDPVRVAASYDPNYFPGAGYDPKAGTPAKAPPGMGPREARANFNVGLVTPLASSAAALFQKGPGGGGGHGRRGGGGRGGSGMTSTQTYLLIGGGLLLVGMMAFALSSKKKSEAK